MNYQKSIKLFTVILFLLLGKSNYLYAQFQDSLNYKSPNHFPWENPLSIQENNFNIKILDQRNQEKNLSSYLQLPSFKFIRSIRKFYRDSIVFLIGENELHSEL